MHPAGWPCAPFLNRARVVKWTRAKMISNGFRPASITFYGSSPRQIVFSGIQDGDRYRGVVVKSAPAKVAIDLEMPGWGMSYNFSLGFVG